MVRSRHVNFAIFRVSSDDSPPRDRRCCNDDDTSHPTPSLYDPRRTLLLLPLLLLPSRRWPYSARTLSSPDRLELVFSTFILYPTGSTNRVPSPVEKQYVRIIYARPDQYFVFRPSFAGRRLRFARRPTNRKAITPLSNVHKYTLVLRNGYYVRLFTNVQNCPARYATFSFFFHHYRSSAVVGNKTFVASSLSANYYYSTNRTRNLRTKYE